jgi:DNA-binding IscR family transcriptional regulator
VLTKKGKYGLKAMVHLAGLEPDGLAQVADIAKTNSGLVYSKKGKRAGTLSRALLMKSGLARSCALSTVLWPLPCASVTAFRPCDDCGDLKSCSVHLIMVEAPNAIANVLDRCTLAGMRAR